MLTLSINAITRQMTSTTNSDLAIVFATFLISGTNRTIPKMRLIGTPISHLPHTVRYPRAVMVKLFHAVLAYGTMLRTNRPNYLKKKKT